MASAMSYASSYACLVPGDGCFYKSSTTGHAILITGVNTSAQTVSYIEQIGGSSRLSSTHSTWTSGTKTFASLKADAYVPIRPTDI